MNQNVEVQDSGKDRLIWGLIVIMVSAAIVANYYFSEFAWGLRVAAWILFTCVMVALALQTARGQDVKVFAKESRIELRKVVWPTRAETVQSTMIVALMVAITSILLWVVDSILMWFITRLTG
ncbi:MAG: preprotein translocase subunit SecE [Pseudomonadota bacterium]|nr:preprotein translocase subunit SecE [Pseudomonadota bacterium]